MPKASIVVPAYNAAGTIAETLRSLLSQTYEDFEIIIVDDGSTDALHRVVARFADPRIRVVRQVNRGLAGARNTGIDVARGTHDLAVVDCIGTTAFEIRGLAVDESLGPIPIT